LYDKVAMEFFKRRSALADNVSPDAIDHENKAYPA
jgi:hypothetical protein